MYQTNLFLLATGLLYAALHLLRLVRLARVTRLLEQPPPSEPAPAPAPSAAASSPGGEGGEGTEGAEEAEPLFRHGTDACLLELVAAVFLWTGIGGLCRASEYAALFLVIAMVLVLWAQTKAWQAIRSGRELEEVADAALLGLWSAGGLLLIPFTLAPSFRMLLDWEIGLPPLLIFYCSLALLLGLSALTEAAPRACRRRRPILLAQVRELVWLNLGLVLLALLLALPGLARHV